MSNSNPLCPVASPTSLQPPTPPDSLGGAVVFEDQTKPSSWQKLYLTEEGSWVLESAIPESGGATRQTLEAADAHR